MNEKQKELVEQYDVTVESSYRSRGCLHLVTNKGLYMLTEYQGSPLRLAFEYELQKRLCEAGFDRVDLIMPNKEEGFIVYDKYRTPYIMKKAYHGTECNLKEEKDVRAACKNLAKFHQTVRLFSDYHVERRETKKVPEMLKARAAGLKRIRGYIKKSGRKTAFELTFSSYYDQFYEEAMEALKTAASYDQDFWRVGYGICHGAYHQHNVLILEGGTATLNMGQFHYNQQMLDLYNMTRKALEKNQYQKRILEAALESYDEVLPLKKEDYDLLHLLFSFPEKFWKISNQYYNGKKCWMPAKNLEKLEKTIEQNEQRRKLLMEWNCNESSSV